MGNTYYKWTFELETGTLEVKEVDISCGENILDEVNVSINRLGTSRFYMYSKHNDKTGEKKFVREIAKILQSDMSATARMYNLALGRFYQFDEFFKKRESER